MYVRKLPPKLERARVRSCTRDLGQNWEYKVGWKKLAVRRSTTTGRSCLSERQDKLVVRISLYSGSEEIGCQKSEKKLAFRRSWLWICEMLVLRTDRRIWLWFVRGSWLCSCVKKLLVRRSLLSELTEKVGCQKMLAVRKSWLSEEVDCEKLVVRKSWLSEKLVVRRIWLSEEVGCQK